ncbi:MAG: aldehyde ferredoxin oxidoreductase C-terminal domain-containing protein, partial [Zestosphaera sp.]
VEDWAARGGGGSVLARAHNVFAVIFGGERELSNLGGRFEFINSLVSTQLKKPFIRSVIEGTSKYSYDLEIKTGGTFGSNIAIYRDKIPTHNWNSTLTSKEVRESIYKYLVERYLKLFNERIISTGIWRTCDEPCPVRCKKTIDYRHIDYEPMNAVGPMIGVLDFDKALEILDLVDELGLDAIETGNILGWLMEAVEKGLLKPEEVGIDTTPVINPVEWREYHVERNKVIAMKLIECLVYSSDRLLRLIAEEGLREACKKLDELFNDRVREKGIRFEDLAVYVPFGLSGYITPNFYWTPGVFAPLPILGKYWTYYTPAFSEPEEFANVSVNRALMEYLVENAGWCRFHRAWVEKVLPDLYKILLGYEDNLLSHAKKYYNMIREYQVRAGAENVFWESNRVLNILRNAACEFGCTEWCLKIGADLSSGLKEWWVRFHERVVKLLGG